jgi:hypothetical protein
MQKRRALFQGSTVRRLAEALDGQLFRVGAENRIELQEAREADKRAIGAGNGRSL